MGPTNTRPDGDHNRGKKKVEPKGILELLGIALGCIGLSYEDFCKLDFDDFAAIWKAYAEQRDADFKQEWERIRILATIVIQPHIAKGKKVTPEKLLPLPWDNLVKKQGAPKLSAEEQRKRMEELAAKLGDKLI